MKGIMLSIRLFLKYKNHWQALLNEQLTEAHQKQEKQSFEDLHEKIEELKGKIKEKD